ncbi:unnamed protein product [Cuscuta epithymum]|uniref:Uncharacterized protein n=1 Tax=Cuscuta epithymum TaxID=186058 RepID=A0AAV0GI51_9ASTE|nr:unnamed protein product [Cuscuta epithymum]
MEKQHVPRKRRWGLFRPRAISAIHSSTMSEMRQFGGGSSRPSTFSANGLTKSHVERAFDVGHDEVSLQFENCYTALKLPGRGMNVQFPFFHRHQESVVHGNTLHVDYVLTWKG